LHTELYGVKPDIIVVNAIRETEVHVAD